MNLSSTLTDALNTQMNVERANSALYEQMQVLLEAVAWSGFSKYMHTSAADERHHAHKFRNYIISRNAVPDLDVVPAPEVSTPTDRDSMPLAFFQDALTAEQANTVKINALFNLALQEDDGDLEGWLDWATKEQRKSEREITDIINMLQSAQGENAAILAVQKKVKKLA